MTPTPSTPRTPSIPMPRTPSLVGESTRTVAYKLHADAARASENDARKRFFVDNWPAAKGDALPVKELMFHYHQRCYQVDDDQEMLALDVAALVSTCDYLRLLHQESVLVTA